MTQEEANKIIHEWMGKCWHEWSEDIQKCSCWAASSRSAYTNEDCTEAEERSHASLNPDYFTPQGFFEIKERLVDEYQYRSFINWVVQHGISHPARYHYDFWDYRFTNPDSLPNKLVEWVRSEEGE